MIGTKTIYCLNSAAVGDLVAAAPALKWAIETFHSKVDYKVAMFPDFRDIFHFVPDDRIIEVKDNYPLTHVVRRLTTPKTGTNVCRLTPSRIKLTQYASINLLGRILPDHLTQYVPMEPVDVGHYGVDFSKAVLIVTTYRDRQRTILPAEILKLSEYIQSKGLTPVYVGRTGTFSIWKNFPAISDFDYPGFGVDLRNKTSLGELFTIAGQSRAIVGMDSGPMHIAFATQAPVVCGFTSVNPELRVPYRGIAKTEVVTPNIFCSFCESDWALDSWDFNKCPRGLGLAECVTKMTAAKFIAALDKLGVFSY